MLILHDKRIPVEYLDRIRKLPLDAQLMPFDSGMPHDARVYGSILHHPDIYFFRLDHSTIIHAPGLPENVLLPFREQGMDLIPGEKDPSGEYPDTAGYNAVRLGDMVIHNIKYSDPAIVRETKRKGLEFIHVSQGYARCSTVAAGENGMITSDEGMADTLDKKGVDVLRITSGSVILPGESYGFLGGSSGNIGDNAILFLGDVDLHPSGRQIKEFISKRELNCLMLKDLPLFDAGSLLAI
ncbi:MAG: DUF6873 family GME fold protein [Candidatus Omnitrophota bacterium]